MANESVFSSHPHDTAGADNQPSGSASGAEDPTDAEDADAYQVPFHRPGGDVVDDIYKWAQQNRPAGKRTRSESLHVPRTSTIDTVFDTSSIKEPGGFRRHFVQTQAAEQGRPRPRALRSFIDFLSLYGHFAGEDLDDLDAIIEDDEYDEDEDETETEEDGADIEHAAATAAARSGALPTSSRRAGEGTSEQDALLAPRGRRRQRPDRPSLGRRSTQQRIRSVSQQKKPGEATVTEAVMMLLKSFVGTGILFLGKAFFNGGLAFSVVVLTTVAMISLVSFLLLVKTNLKVPASFGDMGGVLYGPRMRFAILTSIVLSQLGFVAAYTVFVAQSLQAFVLAVTHCERLVPISQLIIVQLLAFIPLSLVRRIAKLSGTALVADAFILFGIGYLFQFEVRQIANHGLADVVQFNKHDFPLLIGTAVFTFEGIGLVIPITESMKEPQKFPKVLSYVMVGITVLFASAGALGYGAFGSDIQTVVITNLPQNSPFVKALQAFYSVAILLSTPLQLFPALSILEKGIFGSRRSGKFDWRVKAQKNFFRVLVVCGCALAAWAGASDLDKFVSLIGSLACVPLCFIYPPLLHIKACATRWRTRVFDYLLLTFGILCVLFAGSQTIVSLAQPRGEEGGPPRCTPPPSIP